MDAFRQRELRWAGWPKTAALTLIFLTLVGWMSWAAWNDWTKAKRWDAQKPVSAKNPANPKERSPGDPDRTASESSEPGTGIFLAATPREWRSVYGLQEKVRDLNKELTKSELRGRLASTAEPPTRVPENVKVVVHSDGLRGVISGLGSNDEKVAFAANLARYLRQFSAPPSRRDSGQ